MAREAGQKNGITFFYRPPGITLATALGYSNIQENKKDKDMFELLQIFDQNDEPVIVDAGNLVMYRLECHGEYRIPGLYHRGVNVFIVNSEHELLVPTRSSNKDMFALMGDVSVSEHVKVGEGYYNAALRGMREEQGAEIDPARLKLFAKMPVVHPEQTEMCEYFMYRAKGDELRASDEISSQAWEYIKSVPGNELAKTTKFRPDHKPALVQFVERYNTDKEMQIFGH